jgi:ABC-2 type transport system permease protein
MLRKILKIAGKELTGFFASPAAFLFLAAFLGATLFIFFWVATFFERNLADVRPLFQWMPILLIFLVAALTMRAWAEERRSGTLELLLTSPTAPSELVLGKFLGCLGLVLIALVLTLPLPITVALLGPLDWGPVIGGYVAAIVLAGAYVAIGLWVSCRTDNQIVSLILSVIVTGALYLIGSDALTSLVGYRAGEWLRAIGVGARFVSITRGVLDLRDLYYYLSITAAFLILNRLSLEMLRWAGNPPNAGHRRWYAVAGLLALNALAANLWLDQIGWARVDLTSGKLYTLSEATHNYLAQVQEPLLIRGYFSAATHPLLAPLVPQLRDLLREYAVAGGNRVRVEFVDPHDDPKVEAEANSRYNIRPVPFQVSGKYQASVVNSYFDILIAYGDQYQVLNFRDLIDVKERSETDISVELKNPEYATTSAIRKVLLSYQGSGGVFDTLRQPVSFTGYLSAAGNLPDPLPQARTALEAALGEIAHESGGKFKFVMKDPDSDPALAARLTKDFGFRPIAMSLSDIKPFWFYMTIGDERGIEQVPMPAELDQASFKSTLESAVKRLAPGFLKTVAVVSPPPSEQNMMPGGEGAGRTFSMLRHSLADSARWLDADLSSGQVPSEADLLMVLDPVSLGTKQVFAIDQFLMQGGTVLLAAAPTDVEVQQSIRARPVKSGLEDWLGAYGLSYGKGLVLDQQSGALPIPVQRDVGGYSVDEIELAKYPYIVDVRGRGLNATSPITDTLGQLDVPWAAPVLVDAQRNQGRRVTPLLRSSDLSWLSDSNDLMPDYETYPDLGFAPVKAAGPQQLAVMVEGQFDSMFANKPSPLLPPPATANAGTDAAPNASTAPKAVAGKAAAGKPGVAAKGGKPDAAGKAADASATPPAHAEEKPVIDRVIQHSPDSARLILLGSSAMLSDTAIRLIGETFGTTYNKPTEFVQNVVEWSLEDQGLLSIRGREHFARTLVPLSRQAQSFWEYFNYAAVLGGLTLIWLLNRRRRRAASVRQLKLLEQV